MLFNIKQRKLYGHDIVVVVTFNILLTLKIICSSVWLCIITESAYSTVPLSNILLWKNGENSAHFGKEVNGL